jgi:hypothetical protein
LRGLSAAGLSRPLAARVERKLKHGLSLFNCLRLCAYCVEPCRLCDPSCDLAYLFINRVIKAPRAVIRAWVPLVFLLAVILLLHGVSELIGPDGWTGLIYILAGVR